MDRELLKELGLNKTEVEVYLALLKENSIIASKLAKKLSIQRPNVYDALQKLIEKGLVNHIIKNNLKYFKANSPNKLLDYFDFRKKQFENKEKEVKDFIKETKKFSPENKIGYSVEIYEGKEGMRFILMDAIRESIKSKKEMLAIRLNKEKLPDLDPIYTERFFNLRRKHKLKSRYLMIKGTPIYKDKLVKKRFLPKRYETPTGTYIYGNKISFWLWPKIPVIILIDNKWIADSYRNSFNLLWKTAKDTG